MVWLSIIESMHCIYTCKVALVGVRDIVYSNYLLKCDTSCSSYSETVLAEL